MRNRPPADFNDPDDDGPAEFDAGADAPSDDTAAAFESTEATKLEKRGSDHPLVDVDE